MSKLTAKLSDGTECYYVVHVREVLPNDQDKADS
jgi:hypothetical protein